MSNPPPRSPRLRTALAVPVLVALGLTTAACGSGGSGGSGPGAPAGLGGTQVGAPANQQYTAEEKAAEAVLQPAAGSFLAGKATESVLGSTTPPNGDINPYAIWPVARTIGSVTAGDVLVGNFNNSSNNQGTGTTIVDMHADGTQSVFASLPSTVPGCTGGVGLTTAMVQLKTGWVIVGSLPSTDGKIDTAGAGCLLVLSPTGKLAGTIAGSYLDGPWDAAVQDNGDTATLFVSNTLIGLNADSSTTTPVDQGDVVRLSLAQTATSAPKVTAEAQVAGDFPERPDAAAFVKGPTGLAIAPSGTLYVADTLDDRVTAVSGALTRTSSAGTGTVLTQGGQLADPLGLALAPDGDLLAANSVNGKIVEITPTGKQVGEYYADDDIGQDPPGNGDLFDVAVDQAGTGVLYVNDGTNTLELLH
jgi:hypothetical protein